MANYPILCAHRGVSNYLESVLEHTEQTNPNRQIILLGDSPSVAPKGITFESIEKYFKLAREFREIYYHFTDQPFDYELFCFQRWFILLEYTSRTNIDRFYTSDSDVLLFCDLDERLSDFIECDFALSAGHSPHSIFFNHPTALQAFCEQIVVIFSADREKIAAGLRAEWELEQLGVVGVTTTLNDMRAAKAIAERHQWLVKDVRQIIQGRRFDHALTVPEGFEFANGRKVLRWREGIPHCFHERLCTEVRFDSLHFQSGSKDILERAVAYFRERFSGVL